MIGLLGYNFYSDGNSADPLPFNQSDVFTTVKIKGGIYDRLIVSKNTNINYTNVPPDGWGIDTIMDAHFDGTLDAGSSLGSIALADGARFKRRIKGDFDWITIKDFQLNRRGEYNFHFYDNLVSENNTIYEYALVPVDTFGHEMEYITNEILVNFRGVFVCDVDSIIKFYNGVSYSTTMQNQQVGVYQVFGKKYPTIIYNGTPNYQTGGITGNIFPDGLKRMA